MAWQYNVWEERVHSLEVNEQGHWTGSRVTDKEAYTAHTINIIS